MSQMRQPDVPVVQSFANLSGTSTPFSLPVGFYRAEMHCVDPNNPPTLTVQTSDGLTVLTTLNTVIGGANTDLGIAAPSIPLTGVAAFQIGPNMSLVCVVTGPAATSLQIFG